ncbi:MAG: polysaccharide deacetylase family protein [Acidobacteriota bacterium]
MIRTVLCLAQLFTLFLSLLFPAFSIKAQSLQPSTPRREIAITIDDLPGVLVPPVDERKALQRLQKMNKQMLDAMVAHRIQATGFVNEQRLHKTGEVDARIDILRSWLGSGMTLGNHTFAHLDFNKMSEPEFEDEVIRGEVITRQLIKERGQHNFYIRFPFNHDGNTKDKKDAMNAFLKARGYTPAPFTIEHSDYLFNEVYARAKQRGDEQLAKQIRADYLSFLDTAFAYIEKRSREVLGYEPKQIFLIHVNQINAECLPEMLARIKKRGYSFISLDEAMKDKAYAIADQYTGGAGISWIHRWSHSLGQGINNRDEPDPPTAILKMYQTK